MKGFEVHRLMIDGFGGGLGFAEIVFFVIWLLFVAGIVSLLILAIRWFLRQERGGGAASGAAASPAASSAPASKASDPLEILRERYARGEVDDEEYERRRKILSGG